jgi:hypothetical protein
MRQRLLICLGVLLTSYNVYGTCQERLANADQERQELIGQNNECHALNDHYKELVATQANQADELRLQNSALQGQVRYYQSPHLDKYWWVYTGIGMLLGAGAVMTFQK